jgi:hypothetical protein
MPSISPTGLPQYHSFSENFFLLLDVIVVVVVYCSLLAFVFLIDGIYSERSLDNFLVSVFFA